MTENGNKTQRCNREQLETDSEADMTGGNKAGQTEQFHKGVCHLFIAQSEIVSYFSRLTTVLSGVEIRKVRLPSRSNSFVLNGTLRVIIH